MRFLIPLERFAKLLLTVLFTSEKKLVALSNSALLCSILLGMFDIIIDSGDIDCIASNCSKLGLGLNGAVKSTG